MAAQYGREQAVLKLLQLGADKTLRLKTGESPADLAVSFKHTQVPGATCAMLTCNLGISHVLVRKWFCGTHKRAGHRVWC